MAKNRIRFGVNIDHIATIKTNRKTTYPSLIDAVTIAEKNGADLITVHLREDRRHIQDQDLIEIKEKAKLLNLEMALTDEMIEICLHTMPAFCCIVPEKRQELTTEGGLDIKGMNTKKFNFLINTIKKIQSYNIIPSLFIDPDTEQIDFCIKVGVKVIELHTGSYAEAKDKNDKIHQLNRLRMAAELASKNDIRVHAGHGLNLSNLSEICKISQVEELNIGHAVIADSIFKGFEKSVQDFRSAIDND
tara:strand:- start:3631 stop:4371 length:741 start_codon:yes stop_codon:yes gene_type:complete